MRVPFPPVAAAFVFFILPLADCSYDPQLQFAPPSPSPVGTVSFSPQVTFATGTDPVSVVVGDFNGDGAPDLAVVSASGASVSILLSTTTDGAATPRFATQAVFATGSPTDEPQSVAIADFNGDGRPDLAIANSGSNDISVMLNLTTSAVPGFANPVTFGSGATPVSVAIGDFNGDGKPDLAAANDQSDTVSVFLDTTAIGATAPTFAAEPAPVTGFGNIAVAVGDFDGDGKPDLAVVNENQPGSTVSVLLDNTPTGATTVVFAARAFFATGSGSVAISVADFNGDGKPDLAVVNQTDASVSILLDITAQGSGAAFASQVTFPTGTTPSAIAVGDFNGDGKPDLAIVNLNDDTVSILINTTTRGAATPTFAPQVTFPTGHSPTSVVVADFNKDGKPDLAVSNGQDGTVSVLLQQ